MQLTLRRQTSAARPSARSNRHLARLISLLLLISFVLTDAAVVALCTSAANGGEIAAAGLSFGLVWTQPVPGHAQRSLAPAPKPGGLRVESQVRRL
jgi:hypothetical protein